jgi:DNA/RNA endonuclease YhcR with UshA esterase domain
LAAAQRPLTVVEALAWATAGELVRSALMQPGRRDMRLIAAVMLFAGVQAVIFEDDTKPVAPVEAIKTIGKPKVVVEMVVKKVKDRLEKRGVIYLDSENDFKDEKNLGVAISAEAAAKFKEKGIGDPAAHFLGKTVRVQGCVMRFEDRPYLPVHDPDQITVAEKK